VSRGVNNVDAMADAGEKLLQRFFLFLRPIAGDGGGGDGDAAFALLLHPVGHGVAVIDIADLVDEAGVKEDALGGGGLAGVNVRGNADVARALHRVLPAGEFTALFSTDSFIC
jgi:hypothetical protein